MCYNVQLIDIVIESGNNSTGLKECSHNESGSIINKIIECPYLTIEMVNSKNIYLSWRFIMTVTIEDMIKK